MEKEKQPTVAIYLSSQDGFMCREIYLKGELILNQKVKYEHLDMNDPLSVFLKFAFNGYDRNEPTLL